MRNVTPENQAADVLSQDEVGRLLPPVQVEDTGVLVLKSGGKKIRVKGEAVQLYDFRQSALLSPGELRKIRLRHEDYLETLATELSVCLRLDVSIKMSKFQTLSYQKYTETLSSPTHVTLFSLEPLKGVCLLDLGPRLAASIVDRLLGGPGQSGDANVSLGDIETALLDQVALTVINHWCQLWPALQSARPTLLGHEDNSRFLNSSPRDAMMLVISTEVQLGECAEQMQLAFPFLTVEPLIREACRGAQGDRGNASDSRRPRKVSLEDVQLRIKALSQGIQMSARELANLKAGDVLTLAPDFFSGVSLCVEQAPKFRGRLGTKGDRWAIELTEKLKK